MQCPACQQANVEGAHFCAWCGGRLSLEGADPGPTARFCTHCGQAIAAVATRAAPGAYTPKHLADRILTSRTALEGERKQVTVLFADVENFTRLGERLDPEVLHEVMDRVFAVLLDVIHRYEGTVNQFTGDGVMALFGAPIALEDHAQRAVEAALEVQRTMAASADEFRGAFGSAPALRIGLNTGRVVVGKIGDDLRMDYTAQGDTVNLAARLQALADTGTVAMSAATQHLVANTVESLPLGVHKVKNREEPVEVFRPVRLRARGGTEARLAPFVDRDVESACLLGLLSDVRAGRSRSVVVVAEAGVGKSRLLLEVRQRADDGQMRWFVGHAVPYGRATPYRPIIDALRALFGLFDGDPGAVAADKVDARLAELGDEARAVGPALRWLLGAGEPDPTLAILSGGDRKAAITHALDVLLRRVGRETPHVFVFEACQWLDRATEEYLEGAVRRIETGMLMFVFTCRPDEAGRAALTVPGERLILRPLAPADARALVIALAPAMSADVLTLVADRTGGNPLFLEEVTRTVVETGSARIPPTVEDVLMARIDRLQPGVKSVLQTTSVIGRAFSRALLGRVVDDASNLDPVLESLVDFGLIQPPAAGDVYTCEQPLIHEVTYEGLLHQHRKILHRRIGETLESMHAGRLGDHVEDLARHFARAEDWARAVTYHREAGRKAAALAANAQAARWFERALELLGRLPEDVERSRLTIELQLDLCRAKFQLGQLDDVLRLAREAESLALRANDPSRLGQVYAYVSNYHYMKGEPDLAIRYGHQCLGLGDVPELVPPRRAARQYLGTSYHALGEYPMAEEILSDQLRDLEATEDVASVGPVNLAYVSSAAWLAFTYLEIGDFPRAHEAAARATCAATTAGHPYARAIAAAFAGLVHHARGDVAEALPAFETSFHLCAEHQLEVWRPVAGSLLGHALVALGKADRGLDLLWQSTALTERLGVQAYRALWIGLLAEALLVNGQTAQAVEIAERALVLATNTKESGNHTRALALLGRASIQLGPRGVEHAHEYLRQALEQAERLRMRPLVAHCYHALSALARKQGDDGRAAGFMDTACTLAQELGMRFWWERDSGDGRNA
ncbi:MAG: AAA family ATPase [Candidatus Rokubacteria bacterium]|nr:AAA family ATPase [Candidatus Rokubacteria bacterium]